MKKESRFELFILKGVVIGRYILKNSHQEKKVRFWTKSQKSNIVMAGGFFVVGL